MARRRGGMTLINVLLLAIVGYLAYTYFTKQKEYYTNPTVTIQGPNGPITGTINMSRVQVRLPAPRPRPRPVPAKRP